MAETKTINTIEAGNQRANITCKACSWGVIDCRFEGTEKCDTCFTELQNYKEIEKKRKVGLARRQAKAGNRMGSSFELRNHVSNQDVLADKAISGMTLNSGATVLEKGDEQIRGIVNIMEELKTKVSEQTPGKKNFTIQKAWLDKLRREARAEDMEFWYLKFCFHENDRDVYCIVEQDIIMAMVKTMVEDRKKVKEAEKKIALANASMKRAAAENALLKARIRELEAAKELADFRRKESSSV